MSSFLHPSCFQLALIVSASVGACARNNQQAARPEVPAPEVTDVAPQSPPANAPRDPLLGVGRAFSGVRVTDGFAMTGAELLDELAESAMLCFGERPAEATDHWAELAILYGLLQRSSISGRQVGLGFGMWSTTDQPQLDQFASGRIDEPELLRQTRWEERRGYDFAYHRPALELARASGANLVALAPSPEQERADGHQALRGGPTTGPAEETSSCDAALSEDEQPAADDVVSPSSTRRRQGRQRAAKSARLASMAATASQWIDARPPVRQLLVLASLERCRREALPDRAARRLVTGQVVSVRALNAPMPEDPAPLRGFDYVLLLDAVDEAPAGSEPP